jgi:hypothetical protein
METNPLHAPKNTLEPFSNKATLEFVCTFCFADHKISSISPIWLQKWISLSTPSKYWHWEKTIGCWRHSLFQYSRPDKASVDFCDDDEKNILLLCSSGLKMETYVSLKCWYLPANLHGVKNQKNVVNNLCVCIYVECVWNVVSLLYKNILIAWYKTGSKLEGCHSSHRFDPSLTYGRVKKYPVSRFIPHFALYDKKCLTFRAFFKQSVFESPLEHCRVRQVNIIYFLEDDTITVMEPEVKVRWSATTHDVTQGSANCSPQAACSPHNLYMQPITIWELANVRTFFHEVKYVLFFSKNKYIRDLFKNYY